MSVSDKFLLDANPLIEAKNRYYGFDLCSGFWTSLLHGHNVDKVFSLDQIRAEMLSQQDELADWVTSVVPNSFFLSSQDLRVQDAFASLVNWVYSQQQFSDAAKQEFAGVADGWVIAYAQVHGMAVVTHEVYQPSVKRRVPIPNVCLEFNIPCLDTFAMLRKLGVCFGYLP